MPQKPSNVVNSLRDKVITFKWDLSASATNHLFVDNLTTYNVVEVIAVVLDSAPIVGNASSATLKIGAGTGAAAVDDDVFVSATAAPAEATAAGEILDFTVNSTNKLAPGEVLIATAAAGGETDTGEVLVQIRLRPRDEARGNSSKRPSSAQ